MNETVIVTKRGTKITVKGNKITIKRTHSHPNGYSYNVYDMRLFNNIAVTITLTDDLSEYLVVFDYFSGKIYFGRFSDINIAAKLCAAIMQRVMYIKNE